jgi:hypothetical protein
LKREIFKRTPAANRFESRADPPEDMNGKGWPVVGMSPSVTAICTTA